MSVAILIAFTILITIISIVVHIVNEAILSEKFQCGKPTTVGVLCRRECSTEQDMIEKRMERKKVWALVRSDHQVPLTDQLRHL